MLQLHAFSSVCAVHTLSIEGLSQIDRIQSMRLDAGRFQCALVGSQIVEDDALSHASLDGDCVVVLVHLNWEVRRHLDAVCGIQHPAAASIISMLFSALESSLPGWPANNAQAEASYGLQDRMQDRQCSAGYRLCALLGSSQGALTDCSLGVLHMAFMS